MSGTKKGDKPDTNEQTNVCNTGSALSQEPPDVEISSLNSLKEFLNFELQKNSLDLKDLKQDFKTVEILLCTVEGKYVEAFTGQLQG